MPTVQITNQRRAMTIHRTQKYGDWEFLAYEDPKHTHKNAQKISKNFKPSIHNVVSTGTNFAKKKLSMCLLAVLGSQGIVVKYTAATFSREKWFKK